MDGMNLRAFYYPEMDYYELQRPLADIVPAGAIFVHDKSDTVFGSAAGCLKLCYSPDGNVYICRDSGKTNGVCGGAIILHSSFINTCWFKQVTRPTQHKENIEKIMKDFLNEIMPLIDDAGEAVRTAYKAFRKEMDK